MAIVAPKPSVSEAAFQRAVIDYAERAGFLVAHFHDSRRQISPGRFVGDRSAAGFPDLVMVRERVVYAELKTESGRVSRAQLRWIEALTTAGEEAYLWRPSAWSDIEQVLGRGRGG